MKDKNIDIDILLADIMLRISTIEKMLISKNICSHKELTDALTVLANEVSEIILEKANESKDLNDFISNLEDSKKNN